MQIYNHENGVTTIINDQYVVELAKNDTLDVSHLPKFSAQTLADLYDKAGATKREADANLYVSYKKAYLVYVNKIEDETEPAE